MSIAIVTGSAGLIGSEASRHFAEEGMDVVGIDNDMRAKFFGSEASTIWQREQLERELGLRYSTLTRIYAIGTRSVRCFPATARHRTHRPRRGAALARLGRARPLHRFRHQRAGNAQRARGDSEVRPQRRIHFSLDQ